MLIITVAVILQKVKQEYTAKGATTGPDLRVEFESSSISLQLPSEGVTLEGGWKIVPMFHPVVRTFKRFIQHVRTCQYDHVLIDH